MRKGSTLTMSDHFCGCGGSGQGAKKALDKVGGRIVYGANHWKLAIDSYEANKLSDDTDCTDLSACDPRRFPSTNGSLWSPECTTHTPAGGNTHKQLKKQMDMFNKNIIDPATERSRATMWDVVRFAEYHNYEFMIVENVVEAKTRWVLFDHWLQAMHKLGYKHKCCYRNSMHHHPTPQSRDRLYVVFWKEKNRAPKLDYMPEAFCYKCSAQTLGVQSWKNPEKKFGKYNQQYVYRCHKCTTEVTPYYYAAFNCIDWSDRGTRIGDRKLKQYRDKKGKLLSYKGETWLPLAPNTLQRIEYGREKYGEQILQVTNKTPGFCNPVTNASGTILTVNGHSLFIPFITLNEQSSSAPMTRSVYEAIQTQLTWQTMGLTSPPFVVNGKQNDGIGNRVKSIGDAINAITTEHGFAICQMPFIESSDFGTNSKVRSVMNETSAVTTHDNKGIFLPWIIEMNKTGEMMPAHDHPTSTITAGGINHALFQSFMVEGKGQSNVRQLNEAISSLTTKEYHGLFTGEALNNFLTYNYNGVQTSNITEAIDTVTVKERASLIGKKLSLEECYYRMLKAMETKLAMGFDPTFIIKGTGKDQVKQCGNAVTPSAMEWFTERCIESLN